MKITKTGRGFAKAEFTDNNGVPCSIQESSSAEKPHIWLGCQSGEIHTFIPYDGGWKHRTLEQAAQDLGV